MKIFIVIPIYNEEKHIANVLKGLANYHLPIVAVDDGSSDRSGVKIGESKVKGVELLTHTINLGKGAAMKTGAEYAFSSGADAVIFMDSDGQHLAKDIPGFIDLLKGGKYDVIFGSRNLNLGVPLARYFGNKIASLLIRSLFGIYVSDLICGFRGLTKRGYEQIKWNSDGYAVETEMVIRAAKTKARYCEVPVETVYHDNVKGVTLLDAFGIFFNVLKWRIEK